MQFNDYLMKRLSGLQIADAKDKSKAKNLFDANAMYNVSIFSSASAQEVEDIDYEKLLSSEEGEVNEGVEDQNQKSLNNILKGFLSLEDVQKAADTDGDGKLSVEEASAYVQSIMGKDGDASNLTMSDIDAVMEEMGIDLESVAEKSIEDALKNIEEEAEEEIKEKEEAKEAEKANQAGGSQGAGGGSSSVGGGSPSGASNMPNVNKATGLDAMSLDELEAEKKTKQGEADKAQEELNAVYSGENEAVKSAKEEEEAAKEEYEKALENDDKVPEELKTQQEENTKNIEANDKAIDENAIAINNKEAEITSQENTVNSLESSLTSLQSSLSSLPSPSGKEEDAEQDAQIAEKKASIEQQISEKEKEIEEAKSELETKKGELEDLNTKKGELEEKKTALETEKEKIQAEIEKVCSPETKELMSKYNEAKANVEKIKEAEATKAKGNLETAQASVKEIDEKITEVKNKEIAKENSISKMDFDFDEALTSGNKQELAKIKEIFEQNKDKYEKVAEATGIPAELICAIHYREGSCNFGTYLHNGDPLGQPTTHVPAGKYFEDWTSAAIDAISTHNPGIVKDGDFESCCEFAERYNGLGYRNKGLASPYVWAGTTKYTGGMYVADGKFDASKKDQRIGIAVAMKYLMS